MNKVFSITEQHVGFGSTAPKMNGSEKWREDASCRPRICSRKHRSTGWTVGKEVASILHPSISQKDEYYFLHQAIPLSFIFFNPHL